MKTSSGMSGIVGSIMASHDVRMKSINDLVKGTTEMLGRFRQERADADIKGCLKEGDKARMEGFGELMSGINKSIADICGEVSALKSQANSMVKDFQKAHQAMAKKLKNDFAESKEARAEGEKARMEGFGELMSGINKSIADICGEVSALKSQANSMVKDFQKAHQAMAKKLKNDFAESKEARAEGEKARMKGFGELMSNINKSIADVQKEVSDLSDTTQAMMKDYGDERKQMAADWASMESVISGKGRGVAASSVKKAEPVKVVAPKPVAPAVKKAEPVKVVAPKPVAPAVKKAEPVKVVAPKAKAPAAAKKTVAAKTVKKVKIRSRVKKG